MAADKGESGSAQTGDAAKQTKKPRAAPKKKTPSLAERTVADAKAAFSDIDLSEGRHLRKRTLPSASSPKKSASKKPAPKKAAAAPKKAAKGGEEGKASGGKAD